MASPDALGQKGLAQLQDDIYNSKIAATNESIYKGLWGHDSHGNVIVPEDFKRRFRKEAYDEAMPAFKSAWAMQQSGFDPNSFNYYINPFARAAFLRARARAVTSREEGFQLVSQVGFDVALQYIGRISMLKNDVKYFTDRTQNGGFTIFRVKKGKQFRIDWDKSQSVHYHRRVIGPDGRTVPGQGIGRHRPWESKSTDNSFFDRF